MASVSDGASGILTKIRGGTLRGDVHMCATCRYAFSFSSYSGERHMCGQMQWHGQRNTEITGPVARCTAYYPANLPTLSDMENSAWEIVSKGERGKVGFITPEDRRKAGIPPAPRYSR